MEAFLIWKTAVTLTLWLTANQPLNKAITKHVDQTTCQVLVKHTSFGVGRGEYKEIKIESKN